MGIEVQLRSIFLNGLLFLPPDRVPASAEGGLGPPVAVRRMIAEGRSDPLQAALGFALSRVEASAVLVGVTSAAELSAVVAARHARRRTSTGTRWRSTIRAPGPRPDLNKSLPWRGATWA
jgi:aryl-alcohol dehydrogenase-like predicted oxidoreductase